MYRIFKLTILAALTTAICYYIFTGNSKIVIKASTQPHKIIVKQSQHTANVRGVYERLVIEKTKSGGSEDILSAINSVDITDQLADNDHLNDIIAASSAENKDDNSIYKGIELSVSESDKQCEFLLKNKSQDLDSKYCITASFCVNQVECAKNWDSFALKYPKFANQKHAIVLDKGDDLWPLYSLKIYANKYSMARNICEALIATKLECIMDKSLW